MTDRLTLDEMRAWLDRPPPRDSGWRDFSAAATDERPWEEFELQRVAIHEWSQQPHAGSLPGDAAPQATEQHQISNAEQLEAGAIW